MGKLNATFTGLFELSIRGFPYGIEVNHNDIFGLCQEDFRNGKFPNIPGG